METLVLENLVSNTGHLPKYRQGHLAKIGIPVGKTILKRLMYEPLWKLGVHKSPQEDSHSLDGTFPVFLLISMKSYVLDSESDQLLAPALYISHHLESFFTSKLIYNGNNNNTN